MPDCCYSREEIKRKIRKLKKVEVKIRFGSSGFSENGFSERIHNVKLVWDEFFDLNETYKRMQCSLSQWLQWEKKR